MSVVKIKDKTFKTSISQEEIQKRIKEVAAQINEDMADKNPLFLGVLNGAFIFAADLFRACNLHDSEITFIRFKSYEGMSSTGNVKEIMGLTEDITGRNVLIVEDIIDSGVTAAQLRKELAKQNPKSVKMVSLLFKPDALTVGKAPEYVGFEIPSKFILGYGLDLDGLARNLPDIYVLKEK